MSRRGDAPRRYWGHPRDQRGELFYLAVRSRGNLRIVADGEDCHPSRTRIGRRGRRRGLRTPRQGSSMKIARFTRPPCLCGIMDNVWNLPLTIFALEACSRLEENNQAYLNAPAHRAGHSTDRAFYRLPFLSMT